MDVDFSLLYNKNVAEAIKNLEKLIIDVNNQLFECGISTKWERVGAIDGYFFHVLNPKNKKHKISFGIWNDLWAYSGMPLSIGFELRDLKNEQIVSTINSIIELNKLEDLNVIEYNEIVSICFSEQFLISTKYANEISNLILEFIEGFDFAIEIIRKKW